MEAIREHPAMQAELQYNHLIPDQLWNRLVARVQRDNPLLSKETAEMIMDGALGFLKLCADHPGNGFAPSKMVDIGWHTFLMYTKEYQEFCQRVAGRFIHHAPNDGEVKKTGGMAKTVRFMKKTGTPYDLRIWNIDNLNECYGGDGGDAGDDDDGGDECGECNCGECQD